MGYAAIMQPSTQTKLVGPPCWNSSVSSSMVPTLTSNSSLLPSTPPYSTSRLTFSLTSQRLRLRLRKVFAEKSEELASKSDGSANSNNPFGFNFGKIPADVTSLIPVVSNPSSSPGFSFRNTRRKDPATVFVAGATGQAGIRIAQTLLREGFSVRAGVPELASAQQLALLAAQYKIISKEESKRFNAVESSFGDAESIAKAIGNASKVVITIGPAENGPSTEVSTSDALQVVQAAELAGASHVAIIYDEKTGGAASTLNVLDVISSFFSNLLSQSQRLTVQELLQKVIETDVSYTFIKTSLTDDFSPESSYNVVVSSEGSTAANDYKVAKSKIASLVAGVFSNTVVAENKVVQVFTRPEAPSRRVDELFSTIPEDGRRKAYAEVMEKAKAEKEARAAAEKAREAARKKEEQKVKMKKVSKSKEEAQEEKAVIAGASRESLMNKAKDFGAGLSWEKLSSQIGTTIQKGDADAEDDEKPTVQVAAVRGQAKARSLQPTKPVEVRNVFGGLFKQETIYVDDD